MKEEWRKESRPVWHNNNHPWAKRPDLSHRLGWFKTCEHTNEAEDLGDIFYNNFEDVFNFIDLKVSNKVKFENYEKFLKTWVKVKKNWNTDSNFIQSLGVGGNYESS